MSDYISKYTGAQVDEGVEIALSDVIFYSEETVEGGVAPNNADTLQGYSANDIVNKIYPVGSIYMSVNSTSPATLFGGTWEQIKDRFLLAAGGSYAVGATGGEATHTLTVDEMPSHSHIEYGISANKNRQARNKATLQDDGNFVIYDSNDAARWSSSTSHSTGSTIFKPVTLGVDGTTEAEGGSQPHNNMPPYLAVYMWKRVA